MSLIAKNDKQAFLICGGSVLACLGTYKTTQVCKVSGSAMYVYLTYRNKVSYFSKGKKATVEMEILATRLLDAYEYQWV